MTRHFGIVGKGWGSERIWVSNDLYCGKLLHFDSGKKCSMHFHANKTESWLVLTGSFIVKTIDKENGKIKEQLLSEGDVWHNPPLVPHQLICIDDGIIIEVSTADSVEDNYRVQPGDSQK